MKYPTFFLVLVTLLLPSGLLAQAQEASPRPLQMAEYQKAKTFTVENLDTDTYKKVDNTYILDRYEMKKPYFITGDDGLRKRIDLYKLLAKDGLQELGLMIYYTDENGKRYQALLPNATADAQVWAQYFEDIHALDRQEKNFVLKLSYVLSKELSFQQYKNMQQGQALPVESATYGNDICFPGHQLVRMANGSNKPLKELRTGDLVLSLDPSSQQAVAVAVEKVVVHAPKHYAVRRLWAVRAQVQVSPLGQEVQLTHKYLEATPNHPMPTPGGPKPMDQLTVGDWLLCQDTTTGTYQPYQLLLHYEADGGEQAVYSLSTQKGTTLLLNDVVVLQK